MEEFRQRRMEFRHTSPNSRREDIDVGRNATVTAVRHSLRLRSRLARHYRFSVDLIVRDEEVFVVEGINDEKRARPGSGPRVPLSPVKHQYSEARCTGYGDASSRP